MSAAQKRDRGKPRAAAKATAPAPAAESSMWPRYIASAVRLPSSWPAIGGRPARGATCGACGGTDWRETAGGFVCTTCHPPPEDAAKRPCTGWRNPAVPAGQPRHG